MEFLILNRSTSALTGMLGTYPGGARSVNGIGPGPVGIHIYPAGPTGGETYHGGINENFAVGGLHPGRTYPFFTKQTIFVLSLGFYIWQWKVCGVFSLRHINPPAQRLK